MNLKDELKKLVNLQALDLQIISLKKQKDVEKPKELEKLSQKVEEKRKEVCLLEEKFKNLQVKRKDKELSLSAKEGSLKKAQVQLYQLKTNKEYQAKLAEMESLKADVSVLEDEIIEILDEIEKVENMLKEKRELWEKEREILAGEEKKIKEEIKLLETKIKTLEEKRKIATQDIDKSILSTYEKFFQKGRVLVVAPVEGDSCGACHMRLTAQKINEIKMYKELVFCEMCVRILYLKEDFAL